ncbi:MAG: hypothetical protein LN589_04190 [Rickettsia endosymbiont of Eriopis connexa]|nr:hypothetical protein [Rickettsia endosymbiont of Eriopis connexa]
MDDDKKHTDAAKDYGVTAVLVEKDGTKYIHEAFNFLYDFNEKHEIYVELEDPAAEPWVSDEENRDLIRKVPFEPFSDDYYSAHTPHGKDKVLTLGDD